MRRLSFISLILLLGAAVAPQRVLAQAATPSSCSGSTSSA